MSISIDSSKNLRVTKGHHPDKLRHPGRYCRYELIEQSDVSLPLNVTGAAQYDIKVISGNLIDIPRRSRGIFNIINNSPRFA